MLVVSLNCDEEEFRAVSRVSVQICPNLYKLGGTLDGDGHVVAPTKDLRYESKDSREMENCSFSFNVLRCEEDALDG